MSLHGKYVFHVFHMSSEGCVFVFHLRPPGDGIHAGYPRIFTDILGYPIYPRISLDILGYPGFLLVHVECDRISLLRDGFAMSEAVRPAKGPCLACHSDTPVASNGQWKDVWKDGTLLGQVCYRKGKGDCMRAFGLCAPSNIAGRPKGSTKRTHEAMLVSPASAGARSKPEFVTKIFQIKGQR